MFAEALWSLGFSRSVLLWSVLEWQVFYVPCTAGSPAPSSSQLRQPEELELKMEQNGFSSKWQLNQFAPSGGCRIIDAGHNVVYKLSSYGWLERISFKNSNKMYKDKLSATLHGDRNRAGVQYTMLYLVAELLENADPDFIGFLPPTREPKESHYGSVQRWRSSFVPWNHKKCIFFCR